MNHEHVQLEYIIEDTLAGCRLDQALGKLCADYSRSQFKQWIENKHVTVNGESRRPRDPVNLGDHIVVDAHVEREPRWEAENIPLDIIFEDDDLLVINKPPGLVAHPGAGNPQGTLVNALLHHHTALHDLPRAGLIHRLDKDTSGLLVVAKTAAAYTHLTKALKNHEIEREYYALVCGLLTGGGTIDLPLGRDPHHRTRMAIVSTGKPAVTHFRLVERFPQHTLLKVLLETGRTHQIRVHFAHRKKPLLGDPQYGGRLRLPAGCTPELQETLRALKRQCLHARRITFKHPRLGTPVHCQAPLPDDMEKILEQLRTHRDGE